MSGKERILLKVNVGGESVGGFLREKAVFDLSEYPRHQTKHAIKNTNTPEIFQTQRFARGDDMILRLPVPDGVYSVSLLFAETFKEACKEGKRVFDISFGTPHSGLQTVLEKFDVFENAGCKTAAVQQFDNLPSKEGIIVRLSHRIQHPSLAAFIVEGFPRLSPGEPFPTPVGRTSDFEDGTIDKNEEGAALSVREHRNAEEEPASSGLEVPERGRRRLLSHKRGFSSSLRMLTDSKKSKKSKIMHRVTKSSKTPRLKSLRSAKNLKASVRTHRVLRASSDKRRARSKAHPAKAKKKVFVRSTKRNATGKARTIKNSRRKATPSKTIRKG